MRLRRQRIAKKDHQIDLVMFDLRAYLLLASQVTCQKLMNGQYVNFRLDQSNNVMVRLYLEGKDLFLGVGEYQDGKILPRKLVRSEEIINIAASTDNN